jgi:hypothetical protein
MGALQQLVLFQARRHGESSAGGAVPYRRAGRCAEFLPVRQREGEALFLQELRHPHLQRNDPTAGAIYREPRLRGWGGHLRAGDDGVRWQASALGKDNNIDP